MRNGITGLHFGITSDIIRNGGVLERWVVESILSGISDSNIDACYLKHLVEAITPLYSCNRPPGAAGALIVLRDRIIYGWVGPTNHSPSCNAVGCEMEDGHCVRNIHAEVQAVARSARRGRRSSRRSASRCRGRSISATTTGIGSTSRSSMVWWAQSLRPSDPDLRSEVMCG